MARIALMTSTSASRQRQLAVYMEAIAGQSSCRFKKMEPNPCSADVCRDPFSDLCQQYTGEYCSAHPDDTGCALVVAAFERVVAEPTELTVSNSALTGSARAEFVPAVCSCGVPCDRAGSAGVHLTSVDATVLGVLKVYLTPAEVGVYKVCGKDRNESTLVLASINLQLLYS